MSAYTSADYERLVAKLNDDLAASAARAIDRERDLAAAKGITARLRESFHAGCLDVTQARAAETSLAVIERGRILDSTETRMLAAAFLALSEARKVPS